MNRPTIIATLLATMSIALASSANAQTSVVRRSQQISRQQTYCVLNYKHVRQPSTEIPTFLQPLQHWNRVNPKTDAFPSNDTKPVAKQPLHVLDGRWGLPMKVGTSKPIHPLRPSMIPSLDFMQIDQQMIA